jgi:NAD(P)-dependent dehydrogenase (short-subunit alcohol dehydrogenase family)
MDLGLAGRTALITGGSKGIGLATARRLAAEGCHLVLVGRGAPALEEAREAIADSFQVGIQTRTLDVGAVGAAEQLCTDFPEIEILVNNAGGIPAGRLADVTEAEWRAGWDIKVFGYLLLTKAYLALMSARGHGVIINVIGVAGERMDANYVAGSAGNAALMAFTRTVGAASPPSGVRVVGINPGPVETERLRMLQRRRAEYKFGDGERWPELQSDLPFGRAAKTEEIAAAVAFLASDLSGYTTGTILTIDGGKAHRSQ